MNALGFISLSAITVLASPRPVDPQRGTRNIVLDANLFVVDGSLTSSLGLFRYFIPEQATGILQKFKDNSFQKAFIVANVCLDLLLHTTFTHRNQISSFSDDISSDLLSEGLERADYAFQGDIIQVSTIHFLSCVEVFTDFQLTFLNADIDEKVSPYITVTGTVSSFHTADHSFDMTPSQYTVLTHSTSTFPVHGYFIESKRWGEAKKPKLFTGTSVSFGGFLEKIHRERNLNRTLSQVEVEVSTVSFIPTQTGFGAASSSPQSRPSAFRTRWDYSAKVTKTPETISSSSAPRLSPEPVPSTSMSQSSKKRKLEGPEDDDTESEKTV
jgi:hypothetical protein